MPSTNVDSNGLIFSQSLQMAVSPSRMESVIMDSHRMSIDLLRQSDEVCRLFADERQAQSAFRAAESNLEDILNEAVLDADYSANSIKEGPLAGLARTSEIYKLAVKKIRADALGFELKAHNANLAKLEMQHRDAHVAYENAKTRLSAMRTVAELQSALLRALTV